MVVRRTLAHANRQSAALRIQAWFRGALERRRFRRCVLAFVALQAVQRGVAVRTEAARGVRRTLAIANRQSAAQRIQAWFRRALERRRFRRCARAFVALQAIQRGVAVRTEMRALHRHAAAVIVQAWVRGVMVRKKKTAVGAFQALWRRVSLRRCFGKLARRARLPRSVHVSLRRGDAYFFVFS